MDIDIDLFMRMLSIDSTSSKERGFADFLEKEFGSGKCTVSRFEVGDGTDIPESCSARIWIQCRRTSLR